MAAQAKNLLFDFDLVLGSPVHSCASINAKANAESEVPVGICQCPQPGVLLGFNDPCLTFRTGHLCIRRNDRVVADCRGGFSGSSGKDRSLVSGIGIA